MLRIAKFILSSAIIAGHLASPNHAEAETSFIPEPAGYRMEDFRSPVPKSLAGATVVTLGQVEGLIQSDNILLVDVLPRPPKPKGLKEGTIWRPRPRHNIPGSVWLPNIGFGGLSAEVERYFSDSLSRLTGGDKDRNVLFYCLANCWMSWNAAKRALSLGYNKVHWFPEGTDAWIAAGLPTAPSEPEPGWEPK